MNCKRLLLLAILFLLVLVTARPAGAYPYKTRVDPRVLEDTAENQTGRFIVLLKAQSDRRAFAAMKVDAETRVRAAFGALQNTARAAQPAVRAQLDRLGARYRAYWIVDAFAVEGNRAAVDALAARTDVASIESDRPFTVTAELEAAPHAPSSIEWNIERVNAPALWAMGYTGQGIVYANGDTGVQWDHPALKAHYRGWNEATQTVDHNYNWWDAVHTPLNSTTNPCNPDGGYINSGDASGSIAPCDDEGHGTHTMGIGVGDDGATDPGARHQIGVAPGAKWIACRNMDHNVGRPSLYLECYQFFLAPRDLAGGQADPSKHADVVGNS